MPYLFLVTFEYPLDDMEHAVELKDEIESSQTVKNVEIVEDAAQQSVQRTATGVWICPHGVPETMACRLCGD